MRKIFSVLPTNQSQHVRDSHTCPPLSVRLSDVQLLEGFAERKVVFGRSDLMFVDLLAAHYSTPRRYWFSTLLMGFFCVLSDDALSSEEQRLRFGIGYGGPRIQLQPIMTPYRTSHGVAYQPLTIRLILPEAPEGKSDGQGNQLQRSACFAIPLVHEHLLFHLHGADLKTEDFSGQRREVLANRLLKAVSEKFGSGFYAGIELVDWNTPSLTPTSRTLSTQCR